jgi:hypothetical protein
LRRNRDKRLTLELRNKQNISPKIAQNSFAVTYYFVERFADLRRSPPRRTLRALARIEWKRYRTISSVCTPTGGRLATINPGRHSAMRE